VLKINTLKGQSHRWSRLATNIGKYTLLSDMYSYDMSELEQFHLHLLYLKHFLEERNFEAGVIGPALL
jgi:hypothetical protein